MRFRYMLGSCMAILLGVGGLTAQTNEGSLGEALRNRDLEAARSLVEQGVDVNAADPEGLTPLHWAAHWDDLRLVELLLEKGADARARNRYGVTPLHEAATVANAAIVEALLRGGADANAAGYAAGETPLMTAARSGNVDAVRALAAQGGDVNAFEEFSGQTALMWAVTENHPDVAQFLIDQGASVDRPSVTFDLEDTRGRALGGLTPLHFAAREGNLEAGEVLVASGAPLNVEEPQHGFTPMMTAIFNGHYDFANYLIENGADINDGSLYVAMEMKNLGYFTNRPNPPEIDRTMNAWDIVQLLLERGAEPNRRYSKTIPPRQALGGNINVTPGSTVLYRAVRAADLDSVVLLLTYGADPTIPARDGATPWLMGAGLGSRQARPLEGVKMLLAAGADVTAAHPTDGNTAVHYAAQLGADEVVEFLVGIGADLEVTNAEEETPLETVPDPEGSTAQLIRRLLQ